ncbi:uncharacterized protein LOC135950434 [Calliphora vicina]|uniref:uncharacterized protein LOC135950434 n=1 Tax=Calliphora vicina TaxID=7373 RepID=UPI00325BC7FB
MKSEMDANGFQFNNDALKFKLHNLTTKYRFEKKQIGPSGGSPSTWEFYDRVHAILGPFKSYSIEALMDESLDDSPSTSSNSVVNIPEVIIEYDEFESTLESSSQSASHIDETTPNKRKRISNQEEILKILKQSNEIIKSETQKHSESDEKMLKLQEEMVAIEKERNEILKSFINSK